MAAMGWGGIPVTNVCDNLKGRLDAIFLDLSGLHSSNKVLS